MITKRLWRLQAYRRHIRFLRQHGVQWLADLGQAGI